MKCQILKQFSFLFRITRQRAVIKTHRTESTFVTGPGKYTVCRRVRVLFSPGNCTGLDSEGVNPWNVAALLSDNNVLFFLVLFLQPGTYGPLQSKETKHGRNKHKRA